MLTAPSRTSSGSPGIERKSQEAIGGGFTASRTIIVTVDAGPDGCCLFPEQRGYPRLAGLRERKVRTPQSSVPDNVRESGFKAVRRKVPQRIYRRERKPAVRVKRCGKSAPPGQ